MTDTTLDGFLGGKLTIEQPKRGYRAGADPVLLAATVPAKPGESVLELGVGAGVALLALCHRVTGLEAVGVELQPDLCALADSNAARNAIAAEIVNADIAALPAALRARSFDHVLTNPPFFQRTTGHEAHVPGREAGRGETVALGEWIDAAIRRLKPGGRLTVVQRANRLPDLLRACDARVGDVLVRPLIPRPNRAAETVLLTAKKGARGAFQLAAPICLHRGDCHDGDRDDYSDLAKSVLRDGLSLEEALLIHR